MEQNLHYNVSVRLFAEEKCFGPGIAALLHRVQELHSLRAAAMSMGMAYSKAWTITKHAERQMGFPLLHSSTGGKGGGGATLTPEGERLLTQYDDFCREPRDYGDRLSRKNSEASPYRAAIQKNKQKLAAPTGAASFILCRTLLPSARRACLPAEARDAARRRAGSRHPRWREPWGSR